MEMKKKPLKIFRMSVIALAIGVSAASHAAVYSDFAMSSRLEVNGYTKSGALKDFPVLVRLDPKKISGFDYGDLKSAVPDIAFFEEGNEMEELAYEIDTWNPQGESLVWVKVPQLKSSTVLLFAYGKADYEKSKPDSAVWSAYAAVWHMNEGKGDSTSGMTISHGDKITAASDVLLGGCYSQGRTSHQLATQYNFSGLSESGAFTLSGWFKQKFDGKNQRWLSTKKDYTKSGLEIIVVAAGDVLVRGSGNGNTLTVKGAKEKYFSATDTWVQMGASYSGTASTLYINGTEAGSGTVGEVSTPLTGGDQQYLTVGNTGGSGLSSSDNAFVGLMDEVRVYDGVADADWIATEYATVTRGDFFKYGAAVKPESGVEFAAPPAVAVDGDGQVTFSVVLAKGDGASVSAVFTDVVTGEVKTFIVAENASARAEPYVATISDLVPARRYSVAALGVLGEDTTRYAAANRVDYGSTKVDTAFRWVGEKGDSWFRNGVWECDEQSLLFPHLPGDKALFESGSSAILDDDVALSRLEMPGTQIRTMGDGTVVTLTLAALPKEGETQGKLVTKGGSSIGREMYDEQMILRLASPFKIYHANASGTSRLFLRARITGGDDESPCDWEISKDGSSWAYADTFLLNPENDFRGDIYVNSGARDNSPARVNVGVFETTAADSMLGDPKNVIRLMSGQSGLFLHRIDGNGLCRTVSGCGTVRGVSITDKTYYTVNDYDLILGDGFVADPCTATSQYGRMTIRGRSLTADANAVYRIQLRQNGESVENDVIAFVITREGEEVIGGRFEISEEGAVEPGTEFTVATVSPAGTGPASVTLAPSFVTEGYNLKIEKREDEGWNIIALRVREGSDISTFSATRIGDEFATLNCEVISLSPDARRVKVYYGETDGGNDPDAWGASRELAGDAATGLASVTVDGLVVDRTYFVRFSVVGGEEEVFSSDVVSFTTRALNTPDTFYTSVVDGFWSSDGVWSIRGPWARTRPGLPGDTVQLEVGTGSGAESGQDRVYRLDRDETVGTMIFVRGNEHSATVTSADPHTLRFAAASVDGRAELRSTGGLRTLNLGTVLAEGEDTGTQADALRIALDSPLDITRLGAFSYDIWCYAPISGGSAERPVDISVVCTGDEWSNVYVHLVNPGNTFRGDLWLGDKIPRPGRSNVYGGSDKVPFADSMLGDASNRIHLRAFAALVLYGNADTPVVFRRTVTGNGMVKSYSPMMIFTSEARLEPCGIDGTGFGTIEISTNGQESGRFADSAGTTYVLTVDADDPARGDRIRFADAPMDALKGTFLIEPDDASVRIPVGEKRVVGELPAGFAPGVRFACGSSGFKVYSEMTEGGAAVLIAERKPESLSICVR